MGGRKDVRTWEIRDLRTLSLSKEMISQREICERMPLGRKGALEEMYIWLMDSLVELRGRNPFAAPVTNAFRQSCTIRAITNLSLSEVLLIYMRWRRTEEQTRNNSFDLKHISASI